MVVVGGLRAWWSGRVCEEVLWTDPLRIARQGDNAVTLSVCIHCSFLLRSFSFAPQPHHHHHLFATIHAQTDSNTKCGSEWHFCQMGPSSSSAIPLRNSRITSARVRARSVGLVGLVGQVGRSSPGRVDVGSVGGEQ